MKARFVALVAVLVVVVVGALVMVPLTLPSNAPNSGNIPDNHFGQRVRGAILANPTMITDAIQALEQHRDAAMNAQRVQIMTAHKKLIREGRGLPVLGNPKGDGTIVEFFDYRCPYCKRSLAPVLALLKSDPNIRVVFKEFPILGPPSVFAARAAIASVAQGKYQKMHEKLMGHRGEFSDATVMGMARSLGMDVPRLRADMIDPRIDHVIGESKMLAERLGITGTPAFIIGDVMMPGFVDLATLRQLVVAARKRCDSC